MTDNPSLEELRRQKVMLDRIMEEKRLLIQVHSDALANLRREKKRVMELIHDLGSSGSAAG